MVDEEREPVSGSRSSRTLLGRWMIGVGVIYLVLAPNLGSLVIAPDRLVEFYPSYDAPPNSVANAVSADFALMLALEIGVLGAFLLWASRRQMEYTGLVPLIIVLEVIRGFVDDVYLITMRTYTVDAVYNGFIVLHVAIVASGIVAYRRSSELTFRPNSAEGQA